MQQLYSVFGPTVGQRRLYQSLVEYFGVEEFLCLQMMHNGFSFFTGSQIESDRIGSRHADDAFVVPAGSRVRRQ